MIRGRRGISPLIATVLLLAFAVAIGTMVVSYIVDATRSDPCDAVIVAVQEGVPVCYKDGRVSLILTNRGEELVSSVMLKLVSANGDFVENRVPVAMLTGSSSKVDLPYRTQSIAGAQLTVTPARMVDEKERFCFEKEVETSVNACNN